MGEAGRAGWEQTSTECRVKETRNRPSITTESSTAWRGVWNPCFIPMKQLVHCLPVCWIMTVNFFFFLRVKALVYMQLFREAIP